MAAHAIGDGAAAAAAENEPVWTRIVRRGHGRPNKHRRSGAPTSPAAGGAPPPAAGPADQFRPNPAPTLSAADIRAEHERVAAAWRAGASHARLRALATRLATGGAPVTRAVCLGLGAFEPEGGAAAARRRSHVQLAAFLAMVDAVEQATGAPIACFYQEPRFAAPDEAFLAGLGGRVVESPAAYALVDDATLLFGVHLYRDIWAAALEKSLPAVFVGTGWDVWDATGAGANRDFERIRAMDEDGARWSRFAFPQDEDDPGVFSSTCVYWRKPKSEWEGTDAIEEAIASLDLEPGKVQEPENQGRTCP